MDVPTWAAYLLFTLALIGAISFGCFAAGIIAPASLKFEGWGYPVAVLVAAIAFGFVAGLHR